MEAGMHVNYPLLFNSLMVSGIVATLTLCYVIGLLGKFLYWNAKQRDLPPSILQRIRTQLRLLVILLFLILSFLSYLLIVSFT